LNVLAFNLGTGPLKLLKERSLSKIQKNINYYLLYIKLLREKSTKKKKDDKKHGRETYRKASCDMLATEEGIGPERLLLFSRLISIQIPIIRFLHCNIKQ